MADSGSSYIDIVAPDYIGEDRIDLTLSTDTPIAKEGESVFVDVDYDRCMPEDVATPLVYTVTDPDGEHVVERSFKLSKPTVLEFIPNRGGKHMVRLGEMFHNRWFGSLVVEVEGDERID